MLKQSHWKDFLAYVRERLGTLGRYGVSVADLRNDLDLPPDFLQGLEKRWQVEPPKDFYYVHKGRVINFCARTQSDKLG